MKEAEDGALGKSPEMEQNQQLEADKRVLSNQGFEL